MDFLETMTAGVTGGLFGLAGTSTTNAANKEIAEKNINFQRETNQKNEDLMRESWGRDDSAVQRRTEDLVAAGMSPLLAAGSAAGNSGVVSQTAPQSRQVIQKSGLEGAISGIYQGMLQQQSYMDMMARQQQLIINQNQQRLNQSDFHIRDQKAPLEAAILDNENKLKIQEWRKQNIGLKYEDQIKAVQLLQLLQNYSDTQFNRGMSEKYGLKTHESGNTITKTAQQITETLGNLLEGR